MAVMDEFKEEREALRHGTPRQKISYFIEYYKWHVIFTVLGVVAVVATIVQIANRRENAIYVCMLNTLARPTEENSFQSTAVEEHAAAFAEYAGIDTDKYDVYLDTSMYIDYNSMDENTVNSSQKYVTYLAAAEMDVIVTDEASLEQFSYQQDFFDLREILTPGQLEKYAPYLYYIDMVTVAEREEILDSPDNLYTDYVLIAPDPRKPEEMEEPVPVGIYLDECTELKDRFYFHSDDVVACVFVNTKRLDTALQYLDFLLGEPAEVPPVTSP